jgi:hypothetical protein
LRKLKLYDWPIWIINIGFAILFAAALMAGFNWASRLWLVQFLALAGIPFYIVNLLFLAYWLLRRRRHFILPLIFLLVVHTTFTSLIKLRLPKAQIEKPNSIRVMTYNIKAFREQSPKQISENHLSIDKRLNVTTIGFLSIVGILVTGMLGFIGKVVFLPPQV